MLKVTALLLATTLSSAATPRLTIDRLFAAFNRHDVRALQSLYAPNAILTSSDFCTSRTGADVTRTYGAMFQSVPDIRDDVVSVVIEGDQAAVRFVSSAGAPEPFRIELMTYFKFKDGLIVEDDTIFDTKGRPCESSLLKAGSQPFRYV